MTQKYLSKNLVYNNIDSVGNHVVNLLVNVVINFVKKWILVTNLVVELVDLIEQQLVDLDRQNIPFPDSQSFCIHS